MVRSFCLVHACHLSTSCPYLGKGIFQQKRWRSRTCVDQSTSFFFLLSTNTIRETKRFFSASSSVHERTLFQHFVGITRSQGCPFTRNENSRARWLYYLQSFPVCLTCLQCFKCSWRWKADVLGVFSAWRCFHEVSTNLARCRKHISGVSGTRGNAIILNHSGMFSRNRCRLLTCARDMPLHTCILLIICSYTYPPFLHYTLGVVGPTLVCHTVRVNPPRGV